MADPRMMAQMLRQAPQTQPLPQEASMAPNPGAPPPQGGAMDAGAPTAPPGAPAAPGTPPVQTFGAGPMDPKTAKTLLTQLGITESAYPIVAKALMAIAPQQDAQQAPPQPGM